MKIYGKRLDVIRELVRAGGTNAEIAAALDMPPTSVAWHIRGACSTAGVEGRVALALWAIRDGLADVHEGEKPAMSLLVGRQLDVAEALGLTGGCNKSIARTLGVSVGRVEELMTQIWQRLGLTNRLQVAVWAIKAGLA